MTDSPDAIPGRPMAGWVKTACALVAIQHAVSAVIQTDLLFHGGGGWRGGLLMMNLLVVLIMGRAIDERRWLTWRFGVFPIWSANT